MKRALSSVFMAGSLILAGALPGFAQAQDAQKPDAKAGEQLFLNGDMSRGVLACVTCHGEGGNSTIPMNPNLAAMPHEYIAKQLRDFVPQGDKRAVRTGADGAPSIMSTIAPTLTPQDIQNVALYLSQQKMDWDKAGTATHEATMERGQTIWRAGIADRKVPACAACHSPNGAGLPADLSVTLDAARLAVGDTLRSEIGGSLRLAGPLATAPTISGRLDLGRTEITIPERFAANAASLGVKDLAVPPEVRRTLALAKPKARKTGAKGTAAWRAGLDLTIDAPSRLFVRGRGIDAELGGTLHVTGTTDAVVPVGAFELRRGALDVIGRHIALDKGTVTLTGDLDPTIDFRATSSSRSISVVAEVTGRASDPALVLTSTPQLPQDEVLAQFLFGRGVADLTGFQLVQLASAAAQLAGGPSAPDLLGSIRKSTGLDTLGTTTDSKGNAGLTAGRYIGDRIFLGVTAGAAGSTDATVDLDVTRNLKLRGQTGTEGSKAGFVFEKEY